MIFPRPGLGLGQVAAPYVTYGLGSSVEVEVVVADGLPPGVHASFLVGPWDHAASRNGSSRHARLVQVLVGLHTWAVPGPWKHRQPNPRTDRHLQPILGHVRHWRLGAAEGGVHFRPQSAGVRHGYPPSTNQGHHR